MPALVGNRMQHGLSLLRIDSPTLTLEYQAGVEPFECFNTAAQGGNHDFHIGHHQPQIRMIGVSRRPWEVIIPQLVDELGAACSGDLFHYRTGKYFRAEDGRDLFVSYLINQVSYFPGRWLGEVRWLYRSNDLHAIAGTEEG